MGLSVFVCLHGVPALVQRIEGMQQGMFAQVMANIWLPEAQKISAVGDRKAVGCALVKLLEDANIQGQNQLWPGILSAVLKLIECKAEDSGEGDIDFIHEEGYDSTYCKLHFASAGGNFTDSLPDTRQALVQARASLEKNQMMVATLPHDAQQALNGYFQG